MKKNVIIYFIIIIILILSLLIIPNFSYADDTTTDSTTTSTESESSGLLGVDLGNLDDYKKDDLGTTKFAEKAGVILGVITTIGMVLSIIMLIIIGIKYMLGSVEEKADYKKTMIPYLVGAILLFSGSLIPNIIYNLATEISKEI